MRKCLGECSGPPTRCWVELEEEEEERGSGVVARTGTVDPNLMNHKKINEELDLYIQWWLTTELKEKKKNIPIETKICVTTGKLLCPKKNKLEYH